MRRAPSSRLIFPPICRPQSVYSCKLSQQAIIVNGMRGTDKLLDLITSEQHSKIIFHQARVQMKKFMTFLSLAAPMPGLAPAQSYCKTETKVTFCMQIVPMPSFSRPNSLQIASSVYKGSALEKGLMADIPSDAVVTSYVLLLLSALFSGVFGNARP